MIPTSSPSHAGNNQEQLSVDEALSRILATVEAVTDEETVSISAGRGRVVAKAVTAPIQVPGHDNSAMDGYALIGSDSALAANSGLQLIGRSMAGQPFVGTVNPGQCVRIMTGAVIPAGADTVVMQEHTRVDGEQILFAQPFNTGDNLRRAGEDLQTGQQIFPAGHLLQAVDIGLLASLGLTDITVLRKVRVAFFSNGDELVAGGKPLFAGQIYDSNRQTLAALLQQPYVEPLDMGLVPDQAGILRSTFLQACDWADLIITSGGVSVGEADFVKQVFAELGKIDFWRIAVKPGRPLAFGKAGKAWFFGLPGNPVSSYVTFDLFAAPALAKLAGTTPTPPLQLRARLAHAINKRPGRREYQRGKFTQLADHTLEVRSTGNQSSGVLSSISQANCYIVLDETCSGIGEGEPVTIVPF